MKKHMLLSTALLAAILGACAPGPAQATTLRSGGLPILVDGVVVGGIAVSGLSDADDEALAAMGAAIITGTG